MIYSKKEKEAIKLISEIESSNRDKFEKLLSEKFSYFEENFIIFTLKGDKKVFLFYKNSFEDALYGFWELNFILKELLEDRLLRKVKINFDENHHTIIIGRDELTKKLDLHSPHHGRDLPNNLKRDFGYNVFDLSEFHDDIIDNFTGLAVPSMRIRNLFNNDYKSDEQVRHEEELRESKKQTKISNWSLWAAIVTLIVSVVLNYSFIKTGNQKEGLPKKSQARSQKKNVGKIKINDTSENALSRTATQIKKSKKTIKPSTIKNEVIPTSIN
jgi:hypothetical protein